ncbi:MAG: GNAT family N-acetyltransferase [Actinomycetales bacterium]
MEIRPYQESDLQDVLALTIETFRPFYEQSFPAMVQHERELIEHQHGQWEQDYRDLVPGLHRPQDGKQVAVAVDGEGGVVGYVAWAPDERPQHAQIVILAVNDAARRGGVGSALMEHAMTELRRAGYRFVGLFTGGDDFHAAARGLYESLGFHRIPIVGYLRSL